HGVLWPHDDSERRGTGASSRYNGSLTHSRIRLGVRHRALRLCGVGFRGEWRCTRGALGRRDWNRARPLGRSGWSRRSLAWSRLRIPGHGDGGDPYLARALLSGEGLAPEPINEPRQKRGDTGRPTRMALAAGHAAYRRIDPHRGEIPFL